MSFEHVLPTWTGDYSLEGVELGERVAIALVLDELWTRTDSHGPRWLDQYDVRQRRAMKDAK